MPSDLKRVASLDSFKRAHGTLQKRYQKATFDKSLYKMDSESEFVSFGHPLFEAVLDWVETETSSVLHRGATFADPDGLLDGLVMFFEGEIKDGKGSVAGSRLFTIYSANDGDEPNAINPTILWDLVEGGAVGSRTPNLESMKKQTLPVLIRELGQYLQEIREERKRQSEIKVKYGVASLKHLVHRLDGDLIELDKRRETGENVDLVIRNKTEQKRRYELALEELKTCIEQEKTLSMSTPRFVGAVRVVPAVGAVGTAASMRSDKEVELVGMQVAEEYERDHGRVPVDVSAENVGYDIRSTGKDNGIRYIEVKARAQMGAILLTQNEWFKARRFREDYFVYAVMNASSEPRLYIIRNPVERLSPDEVVEMVRYKVPLDVVLAKGDEESE